MPDTTRSVSGRARARATAPHSNVDFRCCASGNSPLSIEGLRARSSGKLDADQARYAAVFLCELLAIGIAQLSNFRHSIARIFMHGVSAAMSIVASVRYQNLRSESRSGIVSSGFEGREKTTRFR